MASEAHRPLVSTYIDDPDMTELLDLFASEMPGRIDAIRAAISRGDAPEIQRLTHQLRGAGAGYGFETISHTAAAIEDRLRELEKARALEDESILNGLEELIHLCGRVKGSKL